MDRPDVYMPLFIGDYLAGTSRLSTELHGAYLLLIMDYWMNGCPPDDDRALASITRMSQDAWSIARASLEHYFSIEDGKWIHKRIEHELAVATEKKAKAAEKAAKAAAARWEKGKNNAPSKQQALHEECPSPSPSPMVINSPSESIPAQRICELFNESFPELPAVKQLTDKRRTAIKRRWNENADMQSIDRWQAFFNWIRSSDFLMGRTATPWNGFCFDWLMAPSNFIKIREGNYHK